MLAGLALLTTAPAYADSCNNPDALGTSRTIVVDPREHPRIGTMQYAQTLPLRDKEVVLTFDDGPIPKYSNQILDILAAECVKATFFIVGRMAKEFPDGVRKLIRLGHTVGTHSENHPLSMNRMPIEQAQKEIEDGIANTTAALGDPALLSPFFRIPGLLRASAVEDYLASRGIQTWSADFPADDWRHVSSQTVHDLAISRIKAKGKGILLLHDIQPRTVAALPGILRDLKAGGYRIVHVEAATADKPKTPTQPQDWQMHPVSETVAITRWHKVPGFSFAHLDMLPAPEITASDQLLSLTENFDRARRPRGAAPMTAQAPWPPRANMPAPTTVDALPVPAPSLFEMAERHMQPIKVLVRLPHHAAHEPGVQSAKNDGIARLISIDASAPRRTIPGAIPPGLTPTAAAAAPR
ncbi:polysaccharide deacetylase family protein [Tardiphaga alba]|uniref:Chitooligosaccharide deacetylase n=2 Tax=Tardiphaga alba TaxID=340268 RepID=A0ABX8AJ10_9BRAD|nr:polysaccharide deacetylase family protein [Tardiphaga alba]QUS42378.1 polysaccharide deacetylase family protein [Tardiphaga alba]